MSSNPNAEVVAVCDIVKERVEEKAKQYNAKVFTDYKELLASAEVDAVCVCAPNYLHAQITIDALNAGVIGTYVSSWTYAKEENSTSLYFEKGTVKIFGDPDYDLVIHLFDGTLEFYKIGAIQTNTNQIKSGIPDQFIECIVSGTNPPISG